MRLIDADALIDRIKNPYEQAQVARWVNEQPTIEPEKRTEKRTETHACDLIDRQAAIDAVFNLDVSNRVSWKDAVIDTLDALQSAQPEIIRCKDCKHGRPYKHTTAYVECKVDGDPIDRDSDFFCRYGERRE